MFLIFSIHLRRGLLHQEVFRTHWLFDAVGVASQSSLLSPSAFIDFMSQASDFTGAKGADQSGLPPQQ